MQRCFVKKRQEEGEQSLLSSSVPAPQAMGDSNRGSSKDIDGGEVCDMDTSTTLEPSTGTGDRHSPIPIPDDPLT